MAPLERDFESGSRHFIGFMIYPRTDPTLKDWIPADISAAQPAPARSAMRKMMTKYVTGEGARIFEQVRVPVISANRDLWPINHEGNRRHLLPYDAVSLRGGDHFLMMDRPKEFNRAQKKAISILRGGKQR